MVAVKLTVFDTNAGNDNAVINEIRLPCRISIKNHKEISLKQTKSSEQAKSWKLLTVFLLVSHHSPPIFYPPQNHHHQAWRQLAWKTHQPSYLQPSYLPSYQPSNLKSKKMNLLLVPVQEFFNMSQFLVSLEMLCMVHANDSVPIADSALLSTVRSSITGVTSHISLIYKGINAMLIIRGPIKPYKFWIKIILAIFLAKTRPDKTIFSALTNLTIDFDFELSKI